jgi:hypothetical protein
MRGRLETIQLDRCTQKLQVTAVTIILTICMKNYKEDDRQVKLAGLWTDEVGTKKIGTPMQQNGTYEHLLHCMLLLHAESITNTDSNFRYKCKG